jgi:hypothetical protein
VSTALDKQTYRVSGSFTSHEDVVSVSPYDVRAESRASSALSVLTSYSDSPIDDPIGRHSAPHMTHSNTEASLDVHSNQQHDIVGRSRSDTARRYGSLASVESAPAGRIEERQFYTSAPIMTSALVRSPSTTSCVSFAGHMSDGHTAGKLTNSTRIDTFNDDTMSESHAGAIRKKRNKCSPEQLRQLEKFFATNRNPTGKIREDLSRRIQMPERSVQVWFQNKRAKAKIIESREGGTADQASGRSNVSSSLSRPQSLQQRLSSGSESNNAKKTRKTDVQESVEEEEPVLQLPVSSLCIGGWRRIAPLICIFSRRNQTFSWFLQSESVCFKLECPRTSVKRITFSGPRDPTMHEFTEGVHTAVGMLAVELDRPPQFYMEVFRSGGAGSNSNDDGEERQLQKASWRQCVDFTEDKQATSELTHYVNGPYETLRNAALELKQSKGSLAQLVEMLDADSHHGTMPGQVFHAGDSSTPGHRMQQPSVHVPFAAATSSTNVSQQQQDLLADRWGAAGRSAANGLTLQTSFTNALQPPPSGPLSSTDILKHSPNLNLSNLQLGSPATPACGSNAEPYAIGTSAHPELLTSPSQHNIAASVIQTGAEASHVSWTSSAVSSAPQHDIQWMYEDAADEANDVATHFEGPTMVGHRHSSDATSLTYGSSHNSASAVASAPAYAFTTFQAQQTQPMHGQLHGQHLYPSSASTGVPASPYCSSPAVQQWHTPSEQMYDVASSASAASFSSAYGSLSTSRNVLSNQNDEGTAFGQTYASAPSHQTSFRLAGASRQHSTVEDLNVDERSGDTLMPRQAPI